MSSQTNIPSGYSDLSTTCSKVKAPCVPQHRPWDCVIDYLYGVTRQRMDLADVYP